MDKARKYMYGESDVFIGNKKRFSRTLVCSLQGYFPVLAKTGPNSLSVIFRVGAPHIGPHGTLAVSNSYDGGISWSDPVEIVPRGEDSRNPAFGINRNGEMFAAFISPADIFYEELEDGKGFVWAPKSSKMDENWETLKNASITFFCKSPDQGETWSKPIPIKSEFLITPCPYGRIVTGQDNTLYMSLYGTSKIDKKITIAVLMRSFDSGRTWGDESIVAEGYNETSYSFISNNMMIAAARSQEDGSVSV